jgi:hypothetical protein
VDETVLQEDLKGYRALCKSIEELELRIEDSCPKELIEVEAITLCISKSQSMKTSSCMMNKSVACQTAS